MKSGQKDLPLSWVTYIISTFGLVTKIMRGRVGMGVKFVGGDGTKILSPCTPLVPWHWLAILTDWFDAF